MKIVGPEELLMHYTKIKERHIYEGKSIKQAEHYASMTIDNNYILDSDDEAILRWENYQKELEKSKKEIDEELKRWE